MRISVITVCFNANKTIKSCLDSVAEQTHTDVEHIVIDGNSTDGTIATVGGASHVAVFVSEPDGGIYDAMNKGIARSTGDFLLFLNADDRFASIDSLKSAVTAMRLQPEGDVYYGSLEVTDIAGNTNVYTPDPPEMAADIMVCGCLPHQSTLARRHVFERTKGFDTSFVFHADYDWFLKIIADPDIQLCRIATVVGSFVQGGISSQLQRTQPEVYRIQNASPVYASPHWDRRRIEIYQEAYLAERIESERLRSEYASRRGAETRPSKWLERFFRRR